MPKILVVEDDRALRELVIETLRFAGYDTLAAGDGVMALRVAEEALPDLIVSDINMPHMDGYTLLESLRSHPHTNTIPVILLTALQDRRSMRQGMVSGADDYLPKPASPSDILAAVKTRLHKQALMAEKSDSNLDRLRRNIIYALPHELRTPLSLILGYGQLLEMDYTTATREEILQIAETIVDSGRRLERLIENYLVYAQLEVISSDAVEREAARNHVVENAAGVITTLAQERAEAYGRANDLTLELTEASLRLSEDNLKKLAGELIDNAFKFSAPGRGVQVRTIVQDGGMTLLVCDQGRGMSAEQIKLMGAYMQFGREFFEQQGLGLGVAIAQRLVHLHDGRFTVESVVDEGTTVRVDLPL